MAGEAIQMALSKNWLRDFERWKVEERLRRRRRAGAAWCVDSLGFPAVSVWMEGAFWDLR